MTYKVKVKVTGREVAWEYRFTRVRKGMHLGFSRGMVQLFAAHERGGQAVGIYWTSRWVEKTR